MSIRCMRNISEWVTHCHAFEKKHKAYTSSIQIYDMTVPLS